MKHRLRIVPPLPSTTVHILRMLVSLVYVSMFNSTNLPFGISSGVHVCINKHTPSV